LEIPLLSVKEVIELTKTFNVIPITKRLFSGTETPVGIYNKLCGKRSGTFLLESAEQGVWGRYSFIGVSSRGLLTCDSSVLWQSDEKPLPKDTLSDQPLEALRQMQSAWRSAPSDFPLSAGLVGHISWGLTSLLEQLPSPKAKDYEIPLYSFQQFKELVVVDHLKSEIVLVSLLFVTEGAEIEQLYQAALASLSGLENQLRLPTETILSSPTWPEPSVTERTGHTEFINQVDRAKQHVVAGDVFQVVISQRFDQEFKGDALDVYRALRATNPSPYMYLLRFADQSGHYEIVGSSPEALVKVEKTKVTTHPIAGSRPRGSSLIEDDLLADQLLEDAKERSEHLMLVDLARNDLLKVCEPASVQVGEFMQVHRFSHVMHLVSTVDGQLQGSNTAVDALLATFPAGTLSGAPKPRALEIIADFEPSDRGLFGGVVGYFDFQGNADLAIAIRTAVIRNGTAHVQAGAGIVLDSLPESEYQETRSKAAAVLRAVAAAKAMTVG
jgi:anthranilate synthase component 1